LKRIYFLLKSQLEILEGEGENTGNPLVLQPASGQNVLLRSSLLPANILIKTNKPLKGIHFYNTTGVRGVSHYRRCGGREGLKN